MAVGPESLAAALQHFGLTRDRMRVALARKAGLSETDLDALEHLEADGPLSQRELGDRLALTSGAITMLVDRLSAHGWVRRRPHPSDRRVVQVELTARAERDAPAELVHYHNAIQRLSRRVPAAEREATCGYLTAAAQAAAAAADELMR